MKMGKREQKQGPPPGPSKTCARRQLAAVGTARRHRLAVKQAKMATARRYTTGQPWNAVNGHRTAEKKQHHNGSPHNKYEFLNTNSNRNNMYMKAK